MEFIRKTFVSLCFAGGTLTVLYCLGSQALSQMQQSRSSFVSAPESVEVSASPRLGFSSFFPETSQDIRKVMDHGALTLVLTSLISSVSGGILAYRLRPTIERIRQSRRVRQALARKRRREEDDALITNYAV